MIISISYCKDLWNVNKYNTIHTIQYNYTTTVFCQLSIYYNLHDTNRVSFHILYTTTFMTLPQGLVNLFILQTLLNNDSVLSHFYIQKPTWNYHSVLSTFYIMKHPWFKNSVLSSFIYYNVHETTTVSCYLFYILHHPWENHSVRSKYYIIKPPWP